MGQLLSHPLTKKAIEYNDYSHWYNNATPNFNNHIAQNYSKDSNGNSIVHIQFFNCVGTMQGYRLTQEDAHLVRNFTNSITINWFNPFIAVNEILNLSIFGVFDGHGGDQCSNYLSNHLTTWIKYSFEHHQYNLIDNSKCKKRQFRTLQGLISQILKDSFSFQDKELYTHFANSSCGSTAIIAAIINGEMLYVINSGDSRCIISSRNECVKPLSFDHKPRHMGELIRINDNGGTVSLGRVGGILALSRAFGDFQFKRSIAYTEQQLQDGGRKHIPIQESQVTVEPDVLPHKIDFSTDEFLVLACDGIWDIYSNKSLVDLIRYHLSLGLKLDQIIAKLLDHGINCADSNTGIGFDNMTIIIVVLNKPNETLDQWYRKMKLQIDQEKLFM